MEKYNQIIEELKNNRTISEEIKEKLKENLNVLEKYTIPKDIQEKIITNILEYLNTLIYCGDITAFKQLLFRSSIGKFIIEIEEEKDSFTACFHLKKENIATTIEINYNNQNQLFCCETNFLENNRKVIIFRIYQNSILRKILFVEEIIVEIDIVDNQAFICLKNKNGVSNKYYYMPKVRFKNYRLDEYDFNYYQHYYAEEINQEKYNNYLKRTLNRVV